MDKIRSFIRREIVLCVSGLAALISMFFIPPDAGYLGYVDFRTLALLYCLMVTVAGIRAAGVFSRLAYDLCAKAADVRALTFILVFLTFGAAMFVTNDVALLTFVPFTVVVLTLSGQQKRLIRVVVLQTVAANLGSILTPVGNPQNIYIQSFYGLDTADFIRVTFPVWFASLVLIGLLCFTVKREKQAFSLGERPGVEKKTFCLYLALFAVCLLTVVRVLSWPVLLGITAAVLLLTDRKGLKRADFFLLLTFVFFFIFSGNLARIDAVSTALKKFLAGREYLVGLLTSQVISNVPATLLLSGFTDRAEALLLGVNVGGLGTPVASLASLISLKLYTRTENAQTGRYLLEFTAVNVALMLLLSVVALLM